MSSSFKGVNVKQYKEAITGVITLLGCVGMLFMVGSCINSCDKDMTTAQDKCVPLCAPHRYESTMNGKCICDMTKEVR